MTKDITNVRGLIEFFKTNPDDFLSIKEEVDPIYEVSGLIKALDGGPVLYFEKIKGFPNFSILANTFSTMDRVARIYDAPSGKQVKHKCLDAYRNPIKPIEVDKGPCQKNIITENIDVLGTLPIIKHTEVDAGRILGGGIVFVSGQGRGTHVSFNRAHFRGKDWSSLSLNLGTHLEHHLLNTREKKGMLPLTINICPPPAVWSIAAGGFTPLAMPVGSDELAFAGGLQGSPIEICKAKTVDAYSIAQAEIVIEGFVDTNQTVWEADEAEKLNEAGKAPFFPEYTSYLGRAYKTFKFQVKAITYRDNPIFNSPPAHCIDAYNIGRPFKEAAILDLCDRLCPGLVVDVNCLDAFKGMDGVVVQIHKRRRRDEGYQRNLIGAIWAASPAFRMVIMVDDDIDIYNADDVLWAMNSRCDPSIDLLVGSEFRGIGTIPREKTGGLERTGLSGSTGFDATVPFDLKWRYTRGSFPKVDLKKWLTDEQIKKAKSLQSEIARSLSERRI